MKITNPLTFNGHFETMQDYNSSFYRTKMRVFAFGNNANGSSISPLAFEKAKESLRLIPIVAKYNVEEHDLESHNVELKKNRSDEYELYHNTYPIGVISNTSNISLEEVNEGSDEFPNIKTYVVVDNVFLWKRYEATKKIEEWINEGTVPKLSMEIGNVEGQFDNEGYFKMDSFEFEAIAALGSDVEPCFPRAEITTYSKQSFKDEFKALVFELKEAIQVDQEGGNKMELKQEEVEVFEEAVEEVVVEAIEEPVTEEVEAPVEEVFEAETTEAVEEAIEDTVEEPVVEEVEVVDYEAKFNNLNSEFSSIQEELETLRAYKRSREESDLQSQFADKLSEDEFTQVFESMKESEMTLVEEKLFALIGKKNFSTSKPATQVNKVVLGLPKEDETIKSPYGGLFEKYNN